MQPVGQEVGDLLRQLNGVAFSAKPGTVDVAVLAPELPKVTMLNPAMPNPFRHMVALGFSLSHGGPAELSIYSVDGRRARTLVSGTQEAGNHRYTWDGLDDSGHPMAAGVFYVHFVAGSVKSTRVITYLK